jgi:hypothetical protein
MLLLLTPGAARADFTLWDWSVRVDANTYDLFTHWSPSSTVPPNVNDSSFNFFTGRGALLITFTTPGAHTGGVYFYNFYDPGDGIDHSTAYASVNGALPAGVSYQMDWPGILNPNAPPTVFDNFAANTLPNTNGVPAASAPPTACCSVAMALIQSFTLNAGETGVLLFSVTSSTPSPGLFYLQETDSESGASLYVTQDLRIITGEVPEPASIWLLATVCAGALYAVRKRKPRTN